ncbi:MAG: hypothetical protein PHP21_02245 [Patescibacteria group bacterium]|nr:hypothetical protein [Patescibacteria group bacterium]MDD5554424.1 hypothetical protein [Patescibacteria group bacterium]
MGMGKDELLLLNPLDFAEQLLSAKEVIYVAEVLDAFWRYNYAAAEQGKPGKHALLKSGLHSDGFLISKILLKPDNIRLIMAYQLKQLFGHLNIMKPDWLVGIPDGATALAEDLGRIMGVKVAALQKVEGGRITVITPFKPGERLLIVEDFCTKGTGFKETVVLINSKQPEAEILPYEMVIVNRGGLKKIEVDDIGVFSIVSVADHRIGEWTKEECPHSGPCRFGSVAIKPKVDEASWRDITTSQL